jgi:glutamate dehydrogenase/leucine dehydrogenase
MTIKDVRAFAIDEAANMPVNKKATGVDLPTAHDLVVMIPNWLTVNLSAETVPFS